MGTATAMRTLLFSVLLLQFFSSQCRAANGGRWKVLKRNVGISAMHMTLLPNDKLVMFDRTDFGISNISLPGGKCRNDIRDTAVIHDCSAHSVEFDLVHHVLRPLTILTDTFCSSGAVDRDGALIQTGGYNDGDRAARFLKPCKDGGGCDWVEDTGGLAFRRWYATNHVLPDGKTAVVIGGRQQFNYEFVPKHDRASSMVFKLPFLLETRDPDVENNLYPFVHLSTDGNLFVFANTKSILLDYVHNRVVRTFPEIPGGVARNYPSTGSSVLLPLDLAEGSSNGVVEPAEVMICGGTRPHSFLMAKKSVFLPASDSCGRMRITEQSPKWVMETMPLRRVMGDMVLLPTGDVLIINGVSAGSAGWLYGRKPVLSPVLYHTGATYKDGSKGKFEVMTASTIPRVYHSTAHLMSDGRVAVGGSNANVRYEFTGVLFPTELSLEAYSPPYLTNNNGKLLQRPFITSVSPGVELKYGEAVTVEFLSSGDAGGDLKLTMASSAFTTHSFSMSQRVLVLKTDGVRRLSGMKYEVRGTAPARAELAPAGYYMLFVVHDGVPSRATWVRIL